MRGTPGKVTPMRKYSSALAMILLSVVAATGSASVAFAQEEGVTLDPGDPAAKEYALPHEEARRETGDSPKAPVKQGSRDSAMFGEGVTPDASAADSASTSDAAKALAAKKKAEAQKKRAAAKKRAERKALEAKRERAKAAAALEETAPTTPQQASFPTTDDDDDSGPSSTAVLLGGGAAVLFAVLLGGLGLRAVRSPRDS